MRYVVDMQGKFEVDINYWTGKAKVSYEGMELTETDEKNVFMLGNEKCSVAGTPFRGVYFSRGSQTVLLTLLRWYDYVAGLLPFFVSLIGGAMGALFGAIGFFVCYKTMPSIKNFFLRLVVCILVSAAVLALILTLASLVPSLFGIE